MYIQNLKLACRAVPLQHLSLLLVPAYTPSERNPNLTFENTEWSTQKLFYIKTCTDGVTEDKHIRIYPRNHGCLQRNSAFKSGNREQYSVARAELRRGIKAANVAHEKKVDILRLVWQELQSITSYKGCTPVTATADASLAEELNHLSYCFEAKSPHTAARPPQTCSHSTLTLQEHQVRQVLKAGNTRKAAGPDGVLGEVLCACADHLVGVLTRLFNPSLSQATITPSQRLLREDHPEPHQGPSPLKLGPTSVRLQSKQMDGGHHHYSSSLSTQPPLTSWWIS